MAARKKTERKNQISKFIIFVFLILFGFALGQELENIPVLLSRGLYRAFPTKLAKDEVISASELKDQLGKKDFTFINVHTPYEGEIEKTDTFIEYDSMMANAKALPQDKETKIVLYCKSGRMSSEAVRSLKAMGYTNVRHLEGGMDTWKKEGFDVLDLSSIPGQVLPDEGFELPISWGHIGPQLVDVGVIDAAKFEKTVKMTDEQKKILYGENQSPIMINAENSQFVVDMLWAFGLAQKSLVYDEGPMGKENKADAGKFASTGGWNLAKSDAMDYYNKFDLVALSTEQQQKVAEISKHVFRPCCGNSTYFPDCNHGMAALAAIELMVYKGLSEEEIYKNVLKLNSFWFPDHYLTVATYFARSGTPWEKVDAKLVLDEGYSSGKAAGTLFQKVGPLPYGGIKGGSCGA